MSSKIFLLARQIRENQNDSFLKFALALELLKTGDEHKAQQLFEHIAKTDPNYVGVYYHLGALYTRLGKNKKAKSTYNKGIEVARLLRDEHARNELLAALSTLEFEQEE